MLPIDLHNQLLAKQEQEKKKAQEMAQAKNAMAEFGTTAPKTAIPAGKAQFMVMFPCAIAHPGVIASEHIGQAVKELLDSVDVAEIASPHMLEGATIVPLLPEINRDTRELSFAMTVTVSLGGIGSEKMDQMNPTRIAQEIVKSMQAQNPQGLSTQILFPTLSPTPQNSADPFEQ